MPPSCCGRCRSVWAPACQDTMPCGHAWSRCRLSAKVPPCPYFPLARCFVSSSRRVRCWGGCSRWVELVEELCICLLLMGTRLRTRLHRNGVALVFDNWLFKNLQKIARVLHDVISQDCNLSNSWCPRVQITSNIACTTRGFPFKYRSSLFNRCISTSLGCCIRLGRFLTPWQDQLCPLPNKLHAWSSFCTSACPHQTTTVRQSVDFLHKIGSACYQWVELVEELYNCLLFMGTRLRGQSLALGLCSPIGCGVLWG